MLTLTGWNSRDNRSGHACTSRRNYFSSYREVRAQGADICCMSAVLITIKQIWKWLLALWIHAYKCNNPTRWWHIVCTEWHRRVQYRKNADSFLSNHYNAKLNTLRFIMLSSVLDLLLQEQNKITPTASKWWFHLKQCLKIVKTVYT